MIFFPYPASKKEIGDFNQGIRMFLKLFPKIFFLTNIAIVIVVTLILSIFVEELKPKSVLEFFGLFIGMQFQLIYLTVMASLLVTVIYMVRSKKGK